VSRSEEAAAGRYDARGDSHPKDSTGKNLWSFSRTPPITIRRLTDNVCALIELWVQIDPAEADALPLAACVNDARVAVGLSDISATQNSAALSKKMDGWRKQAVRSDTILSRAL